MPRLGLWLITLALFGSSPAFAQEVTRRALKPGLIAAFTESPERPQTSTIHRIVPSVALAVNAGESPHPSAERMTVARWHGYLQIVTPGQYTFSATVRGGSAEVILVQGDRPIAVLAGESAATDKPQTIAGPQVGLEAGFYRFQANYTPIRPDAARRFELLWQGPGFEREPVPSFFFGHLPKDRPARLAADRQREHGRFLFEELSCKKCHVPATDPVAKGLVERTGPDLTGIGQRTDPGWLDAWLADPTKVRPNTTMPRMFADGDTGHAERYAVVAYLASLGGPMPETDTDTKLSDVLRSAANGQKLYFTTGCVACHGDRLTQPPTRKLSDDPDADPEPVTEPADQFYSVGGEGPQGYYLLGSPGSKTTPEVLAKYLQNPLATNPHGRMPDMKLDPREALDLARYLCRQVDDEIPRGMPKPPGRTPRQVAEAAGLAFDPARRSPADQWKELGKQLVSAKGCVNCHTIAPGGQPLPEMPLAANLVATAKPETGRRGCLAEKPDPAAVPAFALDRDQRAALSAFLGTGLRPGVPSPTYQARVALKRFSCLNCHSRDGEGGLPADLSEQMRLLEKAENADDVSPPRLSGVGHKLRSSWLRHVLTGGGRARPWMTLRMPQYGADQVGFLADALPMLEGTSADDTIGQVKLTPAKVEAGRTLAGKQGLGCISCHDISGVQTGGTRGPDLATTQQRVRLDWYTRWMHQPQRIAPGTRMPQNFTDGRSPYPNVLGGDADAQIEALWAYFSLGPGLPLPAGVEPPGQALVVAVKDRPEVVRTFLPDAGTKAIAVGYPGGVNLAFDAATCRLGYAWTGNFLDAAPVWGNRGGHPAKPLGPTFWAAPAGFPWAVTESRTPPDFASRADDPAYGHQLENDELYNGPRQVHFQGYALDERGSPTFRYSLTDAKGQKLLGVAETPAPLPVSVAAGLRRTFVLDLSEGKTTWLLVGRATRPPAVTVAGKAVEPSQAEVPATGTRLVIPTDGGRATVVDLLDAPPGAVWRFEPRSNGQTEVLLRLPDPDSAGKARVSLAVWGLPRLDAALLQGLRVK